MQQPLPIDALPARVRRYMSDPGDALRQWGLDGFQAYQTDMAASPHLPVTMCTAREEPRSSEALRTRCDETVGMDGQRTRLDQAWHDYSSVHKPRSYPDGDVGAMQLALGEPSTSYRAPWDPPHSATPPMRPSFLGQALMWQRWGRWRDTQLATLFELRMLLSESLQIQAEADNALLETVVQCGGSSFHPEQVQKALQICEVANEKVKASYQLMDTWRKKIASDAVPETAGFLQMSRGI